MAEVVVVVVVVVSEAMLVSLSFAPPPPVAGAGGGRDNVLSLISTPSVAPTSTATSIKSTLATNSLPFGLSSSCRMKINQTEVS